MAWMDRLSKSWRLSAPDRGPIDLGDGRKLAVEEVLEGHFRRLASSSGRPQHVQTQVSGDLRPAIAMLAPNLTPLTDLAEELAGAVPEIHPAPQFRQDLLRALELTHRQHAAQRQLGTRPALDLKRRSLPTLPVLLAAAALLLVLVWALRRWSMQKVQR